MKMVSFTQVLYIGVLFIFPTEGTVNLARLDSYRGTASQSSTYSNQPWTADKAVDGQLQGSDENSCSFTKAVNRHTGFSVFVFNETSIGESPSVQGFEVFVQDPSSCPSQVMNITINKVTKGIGLYNSKDPPLQTTCAGYERNYAIIEICEVKVIGCKARHYGEHCDSCDTKCFDRQCDVFNGECIYGCQNAFLKPPHCNVCKEGYYMYRGNCQTCGNCLIPGNCNPINGTCVACKRQWKRPNCKDCVAGFYNSNCNGICGHCRNGEDCNKQNGHCINGCALNWQGLLCQECNGGFYNSNCSGICGHCTDGEDCDKQSGHCINGCALNWQEPLCQVCERGFYGVDCSQRCGKCKVGSDCNHITGICSNGCHDHWDGQKCDRCKRDFYGLECAKTCGTCKTGTYCNNITGLCQHGCQEHWTGQRCDECQPYKYGPNCAFDCGHCKDGETCNAKNGTCFHGCETSWEGILCVKALSTAELQNPDEGLSKTSLVVITFISTLCGVTLLNVLVIALCIRRSHLQQSEPNKGKVSKTSGTDTELINCDVTAGQEHQYSTISATVEGFPYQEIHTYNNTEFNKNM